MSESKKIRIFLAHANEDKDAVEKLYDRLKAKGYQPWLDKKDLIPGQNWRQEIPKAIKQSDIFIACLSQLSVAKQGFVQKEFRIALNAYAEKPSGTIYLIPLRLDDCRIPEIRQDEYGINLQDIHWLDYFESDGFEQLERAIIYQFGQLIEEPPTVEGVIQTVHIPATPKEPEPQPATVVQESFTERLPDGSELEMVYIPGGEFMMGSPDDELRPAEQEGPQHQVTVPQFLMGRYPVTQGQYEAVMGINPAMVYGEKFVAPNKPIVGVTWHNAVEFCDRLSKLTDKLYRLPSEAEWEYANRAGAETAYFFGDSITREQANFGRNHGNTTPVNYFGMANAFGLSDMHGNVWEWCQDYGSDNYKGAPTDGRAWIDGANSSIRIARGGSWFATLRNCRSASRGRCSPTRAYNDLGFRVVCSPPRAL